MSWVWGPLLPGGAQLQAVEAVEGTGAGAGAIIADAAGSHGVTGVAATSAEIAGAASGLLVPIGEAAGEIFASGSGVGEFGEAQAQPVGGGGRGRYREAWWDDRKDTYRPKYPDPVQGSGAAVLQVVASGQGLHDPDAIERAEWLEILRAAQRAGNRKLVAVALVALSALEPPLDQAA